MLWCYKKELDLSSHKKKRMRQIKKQMQRGLLDPSKDDPFELFISSTQARPHASTCHSSMPPPGQPPCLHASRVLTTC